MFDRYKERSDEAVRYGVCWPPHDPVVLLSALAAATERLGLAVTLSISANHPYPLCLSQPRRPQSDSLHWQILPLAPTGYGDSPYAAFSAFAGNPLLISPDTLIQEGLLERKDLEHIPDFPTGRVDYGPLNPGDIFDFIAHGLNDVSKFSLTGINPLIDVGSPNFPTAFPTFLDFAGTTSPVQGIRP